MAKLKTPPHNDEAEQSVLGAMLIDPETVSVVSSLLKPEDFYNAKHQYIYDAMVALYENRNPIDIVTLTNQLKKKEQYDVIGQAYLAELLQSVPTAANVEHYAYIIKESSTRRRLIHIS